jgi:ankyrin repeat protein
MSYAMLGWKHLGHVSDEDPCIMAALCQLNSEFLRNTKKHRVLAPGEYDYEPRWFRAHVTLPSLLFIPLEHGKPWMVESLVKQHPDLLNMDIATDWGSPLIFAMAKNPDCVSIFLKPGVDFNKLSSFDPDLYNQYIEGDSHAPISWAAVTGSEVAVDFLLSQPDVELPHDILHMAVMASKPSHECIRKFRQRGADVNWTVNTSTPIHYFLQGAIRGFYDESILLPVVKALVEPSCNLSLQDWSARTVLHIALDGRWEDVVTYLLEQNAGLSATATLLPDIWSWAIDKTWFPKVQAAALAADQPYTRIKGKVVADTTELKRVEFSVAATADHDNLNPICTVVVSVILDSELPSRYNFISGDLSCCNQSLQKDIQDSPQDDSPRLELNFVWIGRQRVLSRLFDYHQEDEDTRMLKQLTEYKDSAGTSLFLQISKSDSTVVEHVAEFVLEIYRGLLP